jgi:hypothetical protein
LKTDNIVVTGREYGYGEGERDGKGFSI